MTNDIDAQEKEIKYLNEVSLIEGLDPCGEYDPSYYISAYKFPDIPDGRKHKEILHSMKKIFRYVIIGNCVCYDKSIAIKHAFYLSQRYNCNIVGNVI